MFEQTFVTTNKKDRKPYTVLLSLLLQVATLGVLILVPLVYTQVLPQARLRSVFAAPAPPPPALPKPPETVRPLAPARATYHPTTTVVTVQRPHTPVAFEPVTTAPELATTTTPADPYSTVPIAVEAPQIKPPEPPRATPHATTQRLKVGTIDPSQLIYKLQPQYPPVARSIRLQGAVEFTAVISKTGTIENLQLVRGHPMLVAAAKDAILQWRYKPTFLNGEPVEVITNIVVNFTLNQ